MTVEKSLKVEPGVYVPDLGIEYPDNPRQRLVRVEVENSAEGKYRFDETYPYIDRSFKYKWNRFIGFFFMWGPCVFVNWMKYGLRVKGRKNLRKYRKELREGAVVVCNHVYQMDALCVYQAARVFKHLWIPMYAKHFNGSNSWKLIHMGGIPVPETIAGMRKFDEAFDYYHSKREWILVFPEEVRWDWYKPIRPFRRGAFTMAVKYEIPVLPMAISYRPRTGWRKFIGGKTPLTTITIGEPILPVSGVKGPAKKAEISRLREESHAQMVRLAGITDNPWPATPVDD